MPICEIIVTISNRLGLHARPAMAFVELAGTFKAAVTVCRDAQTVDGKSIMQMMMLAATKGTDLLVKADGPDADQVCEALKKLVDSGFDED